MPGHKPPHVTIAAFVSYDENIISFIAPAFRNFKQDFNSIKFLKYFSCIMKVFSPTNDSIGLVNFYKLSY